MTAFTLAHTAITLLPVGFGLYAFARHGRIERATLGRQFWRRHAAVSRMA